MVPGIIVMVFIKKCLENAGEIFRGVIDAGKYLLWKLFYREEVITDLTKAKKISPHLSDAYEKCSAITARKWLPVYWTVAVDNEDVGYLSYLPIFHANIISECYREAEVEHQKFLKEECAVVTHYRKFSMLADKMGYMKSSPSSLYPSKNYLRLGKIITSHYEVSELVGVYSVIGVLIDGIQGLGKTKFADFAANEGLAKSVNKIDMTSFLDHDFKTIITKFYHNVEIENNTIFMIDELDKYLDVRVERDYEAYLQSETKRSKKKSKDDKESNEPNDSSHLKDFEEFRSAAKTAFLFDMLSILERDGLKKSVVVIFCSNNFHTIFEGVNLTHHKSLYDRFLKINFEMCDHSEIIHYLDYYNQKFKGTKYECKHSINELSQRLNQNVFVTHRTLHQISIECQYEALKIIDGLNGYVKEDLEEMIKRKSPIGSPTRSFALPSKKTKYTVVDLPVKSDDTEGPKLEDEDESSLKFDDGVEETKLEIDDEPHARLWKEKYVSSPKCAELRGPKVRKIKEILNKMDEDKEDMFKKRLLAVELLDYLAENGYTIMVSHPKFMDTVKDKIVEFQNDNPEIFPLLKDETKEFVYAVTGMLC
ncbi:Hypothetical protein POVR1_LOCUS328 [uncultured virus]|nr:Hypothetical protein POVR1_LOCUS328 [uncultured virus]